MKRSLLAFSSTILRSTPHFKGKLRIGNFIQKIIAGPKHLNLDSLFLTKTKDGVFYYLDIKSHTNRTAFWTGMYDMSIIKRLSALFQKEWVVLDVGANIGFYALPFAKKLSKLGGYVHAFEPINSNYNTILRCLEKNELEKYCQVHKIALGDKEGELEMNFVEEGLTGNAHIISKESDAQGSTHREKVKLVPLDSYYEELNIQRCDFIKLDIEGSEPLFIRGALKFIERFRPIIYGEFCPYYMRMYGFKIDEVRRTLEEMNYIHFVLDNPNDINPKFLKVALSDDSENIFFIPKEKYTQEVEKILN